MSEKKILVLGVGNLLLGDEGVGVHVAHELQGMQLSPDVEVVDGGTTGYELLPYLEGREKVIIVDAFHAEGEAGEAYRFSLAKAQLQWASTYSPHQSGLRELLDAAKLLIPPPEIVVFGIVPEEINTMIIGLSRQVHKRMPEILSAVLKEVNTAAHVESASDGTTHAKSPFT